jgi:hypothetical protein
MATRKKTTRKPARKKTTGRKPVRRNTAKGKPARRNAAKKPVRNVKKTAALTWGKAVKGHPVSGRPCAGRPMSQRDQKLFTKMGKRRAGVTLSKIKAAYGNEYERLAKTKKTAKPAAKKKTTAKRKVTPKRKTTAKRKPAAKRKAAPKQRKSSLRSGQKVTVSGLPARPQKYVVIDGRKRYQSSHRLLTTARKKQAALTAANPRKVFTIVQLSNA